jgi:hypothetical protein
MRNNGVNNIGFNLTLYEANASGFPVTRRYDLGSALVNMTTGDFSCASYTSNNVAIRLEAGKNYTISAGNFSNTVTDSYLWCGKSYSSPPIAYEFYGKYGTTFPGSWLAPNLANSYTPSWYAYYDNDPTGCGSPTISFTIFTLGGGSNSTNSNNTIQNYTEAIYFNATSLNQWWIKPCANADGVTNCQTGPTKPIYRIVNTGTVAINYFLKLDSSLSGTPFKSCANSTANGAGITNTVSICDLSGTEGNLNATSWILLGTLATNAELNVTRYANVSGTVPVSYLRYDLHNSTS